MDDSLLPLLFCFLFCGGLSAGAYLLYAGLPIRKKQDKERYQEFLENLEKRRRQ